MGNTRHLQVDAEAARSDSTDVRAEGRDTGSRAAPAAARRLAPVAPTRETAVVVDSWPLIRAGITQLLADQGLTVLAEGAAAPEAIGSVTGPVSLVVLGSTTEPLLDDVDRIHQLPGPDGAGAPHIVVLLDRVDPGELRALLTRSVGGILNRTIGMEELGRACSTVMAGQRVLSNAAMSVLASGGLDLAEPDADAQVDVLTPKEREVLAQLAQHRSNAEIATALHVSAATVKTHLSNIYGKLGVKGRRQAVVAAAERGLLT